MSPHGIPGSPLKDTGRDGAVPSLPTPPPDGEAEPARPTATSLIDWASLEQRYAGKLGFVAKLAALAVKSQAETPAKLRAAATVGNSEDLVFLAHSLKGACGNLLAMGVMEQAARCERAARERLPDAPALAEQLAGTLEILLAELAAHADASH